jgi:hypothetical protein
MMSAYASATPICQCGELIEKLGSGVANRRAAPAIKLRRTSSTPIMASAVSCRSTSTTRRRAGPSPCSCAPARHPRAPKSEVICAGSFAASESIGHRPRSPSAATAITAARRSWNGATRTGSSTSLACPEMPCSTGWSMRPPTTFAPAGLQTRSPAVRGFAETSYRATPPKRPHCLIAAGPAVMTFRRCPGCRVCGACLPRSRYTGPPGFG